MLIKGCRTYLIIPRGNKIIDMKEQFGDRIRKFSTSSTHLPSSQPVLRTMRI